MKPGREAETDVVAPIHGKDLLKSKTVPRPPHGLAPTSSYSTGLGALYVGNCLDILRELPDKSVDLVVTSPPYDRQPRYGNGERYHNDWYHGFFLKVTAEVLRVLTPHGSFVLNYRSKRRGDERGVLQYELVFLLREQGFLFAEDFIWGKPSPPPGRFNRYLKDAVEYCFQFAKTSDWQFFPDQCLSPARWDREDVARRKKLAHNYERANAPSGQGRKRVQAGPDMVRPSTLLNLEPEFLPNPSRHPARFPVALPSFFINLLTQPGQLVLDPFAGTCTTAVAAEHLGRQWLMTELDQNYTSVLPARLARNQ
jgi:site-specific DNA-methyltransferase (adenine-specific)/site-specific DNA-methyltransferase (cytosine-N4-specific)